MKDLSAKLRQPETSAAKPEKSVIFTGNRWFNVVSQAGEAISPRIESVSHWHNPDESGLTLNISLGRAGHAPEQG